MTARATLRAALAALRRDVAALERLLGDRRPIDQGILDELADADLATTPLARRLRRRRGDVLTVVRRMEAAGEVERVGRVWRLRR